MQDSYGAQRKSSSALASNCVVGSFIRKKREALGLSQRALGQLFAPPVTTQFISNVERGVTPLPPSHIPTLTRVLQVKDSELRSLLEQEYTLKLSERLGHLGPENSTLEKQSLPMSSEHLSLFGQIYRGFLALDDRSRAQFLQECASKLNISLT